MSEKTVTLTHAELLELHEAMNLAAINTARGAVTDEDDWAEAAEAVRDYASAAAHEVAGAGRGLGRFAKTLLLGKKKPKGRGRLTATQVAALQRAGLI